MPVVQQIEGDYLDMSSCLNNALLGGLISSPVQETSTRIIHIQDADEIINGYSEEYKDKMNKLEVICSSHTQLFQTVEFH